MKENSKEPTNRAWMIRADGISFPVLHHAYGNEEQFLSGEELDIDDLSDSIEAAEWLYRHTSKAMTKELCLRFIASWIDCLCEIDDPKSRSKEFKKLLSTPDAPYLSSILKKSLLSLLDSLSDIEPHSDLEDALLLAKASCMELDSEFLRAREGGVYDSTSFDSDLYFRISSVGYDWYPMIYSFVKERKPRSITIAHDPESTGSDLIYVYQGIILDHVPYEES